MQVKQLTEVSDILRKASRDVELATGSPIVAFFLQKPDQKRKQKTIIKDLKDAVSNVFGVEFSLIESKSRKERLCMARQIFVWYSMTKFNISSTSLGEMLNRDHSSMLYMKSVVDDFISIGDPQTIEQINLVETYLNSQLIEP